METAVVSLMLGGVVGLAHATEYLRTL